MTQVQLAGQKQEPIFREVVHERQHASFLVSAIIFVNVVFPLLALQSWLTPPYRNDWAILIVCPILTAFGTFAYFASYPLSVEIERDRLILRQGRPSSIRDRSIRLDTIHALRRIRYNVNQHGGFDVRGTDLERWKMGGKQVLEIELKNTKCIQIASPRADQLTALLHEMTRIPVEDCRCAKP